MTALKLIFFVLFYICVSANEVHIKCKPTDVTTCRPEEFKVGESDTTLVLDNPENHKYTQLVIFFHNPVFVDQLTTLFPHAENISIFASDLSKIQDNSFKDGSHIRKLEITNNNIPELTEHVFTGADNVVFINLHSNRLSVIHPKTFHATPNLRHLNLQFNQINAVDKDMFAPLGHLEYLDLQNNNISFIPPTLVAHNQKLLELFLGDNKVVDLELELSVEHMKKLDLAVRHGWHSYPLEKLVLKKVSEHADKVTTIRELILSSTKVNKADLNFGEYVQVDEIVN